MVARVCSGSRWYRNLLFLPCLVIVALGFSVVAVSTAQGQAPPVDAQNATQGWWGAKDNWGRTAVHMVLLRGTTTHSQLLFFHGEGSGYGHPAIWKFNPGDTLGASAAIVDVPISCTGGSNIFCSGHSALADGRVLVTGGDDGQSPGLTLGAIYNPATESWQCQSQMAEQRWYPTNTTLGNGDVLVTSGLKYDEMLSFGGLQGSVQNDLRVCGLSGNTIWSNPDPATKPPPRQGHSAVFDDRDGQVDGHGFKQNNRMLIYGGEGSDGLPLPDVWQATRTNLSEWSWSDISPSANVPPARSWSSAILSTSGPSMIVFGGKGADGTARKDVRKLTLSGTPAWSDITPTGGPSERFLHTAVYDPVAASMVVYGGVDHLGTLADDKVWKLSLSGTPTWSEATTTGGPPPKLQGHTAVLKYRPAISLREMYIFGGMKADGSFSNETWKLNLGTNVWSQEIPCTLDVLPAGRWKHSAVWHETGSDNTSRIIVYGGETSGGLSNEVWDLRFNKSCGGSGSSWPVWRLRSTVPPARAGHAAVFDTRQIHAVKPELFSNGTWTVLGQNSYKWLSLYPQMYLLPGGKVFYAANNDTTFLLSNPGLSSASWDTQKKASGFRGGSSVMFSPGKVMKCGGESTVDSRTAWIDLSAGESADWQTGPAIPENRARHNVTMLPTGKVLLTGGLSGSTIGTAVKEPRIWDPMTSPPTWGPLLAPEPVARDYHSSALLLPDGRVLSAGGQANGSDNLTATIFWPPCLFNADGSLATKPQIANLDTVVTYGSTFGVCLTDTTNITKVALIKPSAVTHQFNQDQRYIPLSFTSGVFGTTRQLQVTGPVGSNYAPPGDYLLFLVKWNGVPSVARWVRVQSGCTAVSEPCYARSDLSNPLASGTEEWTKTNGPHFLGGSLTVGPGKTLVIQDSTVVKVGGTGTRLIVESGGTLDVRGTASKNVQFVSSKCTPAEGDWWGIDVRAGATLKISRATIKHAVYGVYMVNPDSARVSYCTLSNNQNYDIWIDGSNSNPTKVMINNNTITVGGGSGILFKQSDGGGTIKGNSITGSATNPTTSSGIVVGEDTNAAVLITENTITGCGGGDGIKLEISGTSIVPTLTRNTIQNNKHGIRSLKGGALIGTTSLDSDNFLNGSNTHAIWVQGGSPTIRNNQITGNTYGVTKKSSGSPNLGTLIPDDPGNNNLSGNTTYCIWNQTSVGITAVGNYFGDCDGSGQPPVCWSGLIFNPNHACLPPASARRPAVEVVPVGTDRIVRILPNPVLGPEIQVDLELASDGEEVELELFDVAGRRVARRSVGALPAGRQIISWSLKEAEDRWGAAGVYFLRVSFGREVKSSMKFLVVR